MRRGKPDNTQRATVQAFQQAGWSVLDLKSLGGGAPDLLVAKHGVSIVLELKSGSKKRRDNQIEWAQQWRGEYLWGNNPLYLLEQAEAILEARER